MSTIAFHPNVTGRYLAHRIGIGRLRGDKVAFESDDTLDYTTLRMLG